MMSLVARGKLVMRFFGHFWMVCWLLKSVQNWSSQKLISKEIEFGKTYKPDHMDGKDLFTLEPSQVVCKRKIWAQRAWWIIGLYQTNHLELHWYIFNHRHPRNRKDTPKRNHWFSLELPQRCPNIAYQSLAKHFIYHCVELHISALANFVQLELLILSSFHTNWDISLLKVHPEVI